MTQVPPQSAPSDSTSTERADSAWESMRDRVLAALEEDPINEGQLVRHLDRRAQPGTEPAQRVLAALTGLGSRPVDASRQLAEALELREQWSAAWERPVPLRLALLDILLRENRRRPDPLLAEFRLTTAPAVAGLLDPSLGPTSAGALLGEVQTELRRARRFRQECALLWLHLDGWDDLMWEAGAAAAERLFGETVLLINNEIRDVDWSARTMSHDLAVFLSGTGRLGALLVAGRISAKLRGLSVPLGGASQVTVSIGVATFPEDAQFGPELLSAAQRGMFRSQAGGGDTVADASRAPERRLIRVDPGRVRIVVMTRTAGASGDPDQKSTEGLKFASPVPYEVGTLLDLDCIEVAGPGRARLAGRVVLLQQRLDGRFDVGVVCNLRTPGAALLCRDAAPAP